MVSRDHRPALKRVRQFALEPFARLLVIGQRSPSPQGSCLGPNEPIVIEPLFNLAHVPRLRRPGQLETEDHIRIISMRKAGRHEQAIYRENLI